MPPDTRNRDSLLRHGASVVSETDMLMFEDALHDPNVHHLFPVGSDIAGCGIHKSEVPRCANGPVYPQDLMKRCSACGAERCPACAARYWRCGDEPRSPLSSPPFWPPSHAGYQGEVVVQDEYLECPACGWAYPLDQGDDYCSQCEMEALLEVRCANPAPESTLRMAF